MKYILYPLFAILIGLWLGIMAQKLHDLPKSPPDSNYDAFIWFMG